MTDCKDPEKTQFTSKLNFGSEILKWDILALHLSFLENHPGASIAYIESTADGFLSMEIALINTHGNKNISHEV